MTKQFLVALSLIAAPLAYSQTTPNPVDLGLQPYHDYQGGAIDHVNVDNGGLTLTIPILSYPQRGNALKLNFDLVYNGSGLTYGETCFTFPVTTPPAPPQCDYLWSGFVPSPDVPGGPILTDMQALKATQKPIAVPSTSPQWYFNQVTFKTADGGSHPAAQTSNGQMSLDGSGYQNNFTEQIGLAATDTCVWGCNLPSLVTSPYLVGTGGGITWIASDDSTGSLARIDADGNYILSTTTDTPSDNPAIPYATVLETYTDTAGRTFSMPILNYSPTAAQSAVCPGPLPITEIAAWTPSGYTAAGHPGAYTFCYVNITLTLGGETDNPVGNVYYPVSSNKTATVLQSIVLPNGQSWVFEYNENLVGCGETTNVGDLTHITFPTGGTIDYTYECLNSTIPSSGGITNLFNTLGTAVTSRTVNANDGTGPHTWQYTYTGGGNSVVTDPSNNDTTDVVTVVSGQTTNSQRVVTQYSGTGSSRTPLRTTTTLYPYQYTSSSGYPLHPISETVTLNDTGQSATTKYQFCCDFSYYSTTTGNFPEAATYGKVTDTQVYDYSGALLKETQDSYLFQTNANYLNPGFFDLKSQETVLSGNGTQMAQTNYYYDGSTPVTSGIAALSGSQMTAPLYSVEGHLTSKSSWLNTTGASLTTTMSYYDTGELYQATDPMGHTTFTYFCTGSTPNMVPCSASAYMGALPTASSNALGQTSTFTYRTDTGQKLSQTDPNQQTTTYTYNDPLNRTTSIVYPDVFPGTSMHGETDIQYNDTGSIGVTVTEKITPSVSKQTQAIVDGVGRLSQTILLSDSPTPSYTQTSYDAMGRTSQVWNPTRCNPATSTGCSGETTWGVTTHLYDALSREITTIPPDGAASTNNVATQYLGNTTTVTDQAGVALQSTTDALGRLTQVTEVNPGWVTAYQYDPLSNLVCVEQHGGVAGTGCSASPSSDATSPWRVRRFTYDSLSRLLTSNNPETGLLTYNYDNDSNVISKTDSRGITINYSPAGSPIDALNRVTEKTYSDGEPAVTYSYDSTSVTNGIGRRTGMTDAAGSTVWSYDPVGKVTTETRATNGITKSMTTAYDLSGDPYTTTYPSGDLIQYQPNGAGEVVSATDTAHGINYAQNLTYAPTGGLTSGVYGATGGFAGISFQDSYNSRLQPILLQASSPNATLLSLNYHFGLGTNDNGNVQGITNNKNSARSQSFTYDGVNRLLTAQSGTWGVQFTYDPWGNLYQTTGLAGTNLVNPMSVPADQSATNFNRLASSLVSYQYSANGNMTTVGAAGYSFNAENQISATAGYTYLYDGDGERVVKNSQAAEPATGSSGAIQIAGIEQTLTTSATYASVQVSITGAEGSHQVCTTTYQYEGGKYQVPVTTCSTVADTGTLTVTVGGIAAPATYGSGSNDNTVAAAVATAINNDNNLVSANNVTGTNLVTITSRTSGPSGDYPISITNGTDFSGTDSGTTLTGGSAGTTVSDSGTVTVTYNDTAMIIPWGPGTAAGTTAQGIASAIGNALQTAYSGLLTVTTTSSTVSVNSVQTGSATNVPLTVSVADSSGGVFGTASFTASASGMTGGANAIAAAGTLYWGSAAESDAQGNPTSEYIFVGGVRVARRDIATGSVYYYLADHLGSSNVVTDAQGNIQNESDFYPFGGENQITDNLPNQKYKFTGKERDTESGLDYFGARYYASNMGRFMSPDPKMPNSSHLMNPQKWNKYAYTLNNPLSMFDPDGEDPIYVFRPLATSNGAAWDRAVANAAKHGNDMHVLNGKAATAQAYTDALKTPSAHVVTSGHTVDDNTGTAGSVQMSDKSVGTLGAPVNPDGTGGYTTPVPTPTSSATDVAVFGCDSDGLASQYTSTTFSGTSGPEFTQSLDAGALAYSNVIGGNGTVTQADKAAQGAMSADHNTMSNKDVIKSPRVDEHDKKPPQ